MMPTRPRVLLVESDEGTTHRLRSALAHESSLALFVAKRLADARSAIDAYGPDVVIAELELPDGNGIELAREASYPVLVMAASGDEAAAVRAMDAGALDYFVKSDAMFRDLPHIVRRALREWNNMQARTRADRIARAQYDIASALATSITVAGAGPRILSTICTCAGWVLGEVWRVDARQEVLRRDAFWSADESLYDEATNYPDVVPWRGEDAQRIGNLHELPQLDRRCIAGERLRGAFGHAIVAAGTLLGVMTFYSRDVEAPDDELRQLLQATSSQIAVFVARQEAEEDRIRLNQVLVERERLATIGHTVACLAHEISNPLSGMYLAGQLMQLRLAGAPDPDPKLAEALARMMRENRRLNALLDEFRSLSMRQIIERTPTDLHELLDDVLAMQRSLLEEARIRVAVEIRGPMPRVSLDAAKLTQVLLNLTKNAAEAMSDRGGRITIRAWLTDEALVIEVEDDGLGIPDHVDVFEPFRTTKPKGTGLGLPIARQILAAHGGTLECTSKPGAGATFRISIPLEG